MHHETQIVYIRHDISGAEDTAEYQNISILPNSGDRGDVLIRGMRL